MTPTQLQPAAPAASEALQDGLEVAQGSLTDPTGGVAMTFGRSLALSAGLHAAALGCALFVAFGRAPGEHGRRYDASLLFAEALPEDDWQEPEPPSEQPTLDALDEPPVEVQPVPEEVRPFEPDPLPVPFALSDAAWERLDPSPLARALPPPPPEEPPRPNPAVASSPPPAAPAPPPGEDRALAILEAQKPAYPRVSLRLEEQGTVTVRIHVGPDGRVRDVELVASSGFARLDEAALEAVRAWVFRPALVGGEPVADSLLHNVTFRLDAAN